MQIPRSACPNCDMNLVCPKCSNMNVLNNEWATIKDDMKQQRKHTTNEIKEVKKLITFFSLAILCMLVIVIAMPLASHLSQVSPKNCYAKGEGLKTAVTNESANAVLYTVDQFGREYIVRTKNVECELVSESSDKKLDCSIKKIRGNQYEISYKPLRRGRHQLHIEVEGEHIEGSPFTVTVELVKKLEGLRKPYGMAFNQRGDILVAEKDGNCISIFSPTGERLKQFGSKGSGPGQFFEPHGVVVDDDGNILVTDYNDRIQKFSSDYKFLQTIGSHGSGPLQFNHPLYIAISPITKKIVIPDWSNHRVQILNPDLTFNNGIGRQGSGNGEFNHPYGVAFDSAGNMYVTDASKNNVQVFNPEGDYSRRFGTTGKGDGELDYPTGIYIDSDDTVYIADGNNHRISVFTHEGEFLRSFGTYGSGLRQFYHTRGVIIDKNGTIYVAEKFNNRIQIFLK